MAVVTLLGSLASGMPLASMFKVYTYVMCKVYHPSISALTATLLPPAPQLPNPPECASPYVEKATSSYSAAMVTTGALLGLLTLSRASRLSRRFGRKPLLLITHLVLAVSLLFFRLTVLLPPYAAAAGLFASVVFSEASAGAPLRIAIQNYVVDTTSEAQRAGALSFIEGFGQIGAFPSSALGGLLASLTHEFFAPFYADVALLLLVFAYILILVPESKEHHQRTVVDSWARDDAENGTADAADDQHDEASNSRNASPDGRTGACSSSAEGNNSAYTWSTWQDDAVEHDGSFLQWRSRLRALNFLRPLYIFRPQKLGHADISADDAISPSASLPPTKQRTDWRLLNLAFVVVFEETYQIFMVPLLLLFNGQHFGFDVLQNSYLISVLQSTRALYLTAVFPAGVAIARRYVAKAALARRKRKLALVEAQRGERQPLAPGHEVHSRDYGALASGSSGTTPSAVQTRPERRRPSHRSAASFGYANLSKRSSRTSNTFETESVFLHQPAELIKRIQRGKLDVSIMVASYLLALVSFLLLASSTRPSWSTPWIPLVLGVVLLQLSSGATSVRTALIVNAVAEEDQTKALAAHQILCTTSAATMPLLTSLVYGAALERGRPELVWLFKAVFAALSVVGAATLFWTHRGFHDKVHDSDEDDEHDDDNDEGSHNEDRTTPA